MHWKVRSGVVSISAISFFLRFYLFIFRQRGREGEREGEKHQCVVASHMPPTGDLASNPDMCPDWELNWQPFSSRTGAQSTEPHHPGLSYFYIVQRRVLSGRAGLAISKALQEKQEASPMLYCCPLHMVGERGMEWREAAGGFGARKITKA